MFKRVAGTKDILPGEVYSWQEIEKIGRSVFSTYNYQEIRTPVIEELSLFNRSLGESAEIVQKQMFVIKTKEDEYVLRPEGTAAIVRAYIENNLDKTTGFLKFFYIGPMFRFERPQKGRLRQFNHLGCEVIGSVDPGVDIEVISLADNLLKSLSVQDYRIKLNSLGCSKDKIELAESLRKKLKVKLTQLCEDCNNRFKTNVLRILDCKNEACKEVIGGLDINDAHICQECKDHFNKVRSGLDALKINYEFSPTLVRGLDYYTKTVFEITHESLGSQDAIGAGGRYDNLVKELGGPDLGAMGFAFGMERLLLVTSCKSQVTSRNLTFMITLGEAAKAEGIKLINKLRKEGIPCDTDYESKSLKGAMRRANDLGANFVLIIGDDELRNNVVTLKNMKSSEQKQVGLADLVKELKC